MEDLTIRHTHNIEGVLDIAFRISYYIQDTTLFHKRLTKRSAIQELEPDVYTL